MKSPREKVTKILEEFDAKGNTLLATNKILALYAHLLYQRTKKEYYVLAKCGNYVSHPEGLFYSTDPTKAIRFKTMRLAQIRLSKLNHQSFSFAEHKYEVQIITI